MRRITSQDRFRYWFDNTMSRGPIALIGWLFLISAVLILIVAAVVASAGVGPEGENFPSLIWKSLMRTLDAGNMADDAGSPVFVAAMFTITMGGIFIVSTLIGVLTSGIEGRLEILRKGRSFVVEQNHTLVLGWSPQVFSIISELVIANANQRNACIVVLADKDKVEMEEEIRSHVGSTGKTRVVCRSGSPVDLSDLEIVNPQGARSIIILSPDSSNPDSQVIKSILALTNNPRRRKAPYHIVAEIHDAKNLEVARMVGRDEAELILVGDLIARITVQTSQQSGLSVVYTELLDFDGDEIYFKEELGLVGKTFGAALAAYEKSSVIGLLPRGGKVQLAPPMDTVIGAGDQIIAVTADDDTLVLSGVTDYKVEQAALRERPVREATPQNTLVLGWNERAVTIIRELNNYVAPGSKLLVVTDVLDDPDLLERQFAGLSNQTVDLQFGDVTDRSLLDTLQVANYQRAVVLGHSENYDEQEADARTLITLLHLRNIVEQSGKPLAIVSEMLDPRNRELAEVTRADDFIVSDKLVGLLLSQISENKNLAAVFADLFDEEGIEVYLKPVGDYVAVGQPLNFYTILEAAARRGEVAFGYRRRKLAGDASAAYGVKINPIKSEVIAFEEGDRVIVLADA